MTEGMTDGPVRPFTRRQADVVQGIGRGRSYREIGEDLGIAECTVRNAARDAALLFNDDMRAEVESHRLLLYLWLRQRRWELHVTAARPKAHALTVAEIIGLSETDAQAHRAHRDTRAA